MNQKVSTGVSERTYQRWDHSKITFQTLTDLEVELAVLSRELTRLEGLSTRIVSSLHELRLSLQEQELPD